MLKCLEEVEYRWGDKEMGRGEKGRQGDKEKNS
jgi:hypothetical protein